MPIKFDRKYTAIAQLREPDDWIVASRVKKEKAYVVDVVVLLQNQQGLRLKRLDGTERSVTFKDGLNCFHDETRGDEWIDTHFVILARRRKTKTTKETNYV